MGNHGRDDSGRNGDNYIHEDPVVDEALEWFSRLRNKEPDAAMRRDFEAWLSRSPRHEKEYRDLEAIWGSDPFIKAVQAMPVDPAIRRPRSGRWPMRSVAVAAVVLLAAGIWQYPSLMIAWKADYTTATGGQSTVQLQDGSTMMLNTASAVAVDFEGGRRSVTLLQGEAFFDVQHDIAHPFRVTGHFGVVEVSGTAFSVRTDDDEDEVVLERGKVQVTCLCESRGAAELSPGEAVTVTATEVSAVRASDPSVQLAWREGRIAFSDARLDDVITELRRYYGRSILVADERVNRLVVTGNYRLDNVEGAIRTLADAAGVEMTRLPGGFIILR